MYMCGGIQKKFQVQVGRLSVHVETSPSPGFRLRVACHSYKLHPHKCSVRSHLYKHITLTRVY